MMQPLKKLLCLFPLLAPVVSSPTGSSSLESYVKNERARSLQGILDNIGSQGRLSVGAASGVVVASPSTVNPNYVYTWTRDSASTLKTLIDEFINGNKSLQSHIEDYIHVEAILHTVSNPSGTLYSGAGLGEPKFFVNVTRFDDPWGRPQRDGPALRAIAIMTYINWLVDHNETERAREIIWPVVRNDLNYVGQYWNQTGFDLWEEVNGSSFFTIQNQYRSLVEGSAVAKKIGVDCKSCDSQAPQLSCFLQSFWNGTTLIANINTKTVRSGRDVNPLLGSIAVFDVEASCDDPTFQPCNSQILASHKVLIDSFRGLYPINQGLPLGKAAAVGRYPEDIFYGGNPWYLATLAAAEVLYDAIAQWKAQKQLTVDDTSYAFFKDLYPHVKKGCHKPIAVGTSEFAKIIKSVSKYADGFVSIVQKYTPVNGSLSEEFRREDGLPISAYDLTWSFASFVTMSQRRSGQYPASWGASKAPKPASACSGTSAKGTYAPAIAAGAPSIPEFCTVNVQFNVNATTKSGEMILISGDTPALGQYDPLYSYYLNAGNYTQARPLWSLELELPAGSTQKYKYLRKQSDNTYTFEKDTRTLSVPQCGSNTIVVEDAWT